MKVARSGRDGNLGKYPGTRTTRACRKLKARVSSVETATSVKGPESQDLIACRMFTKVDFEEDSKSPWKL